MSTYEDLTGSAAGPTPNSEPRTPNSLYMKVFPLPGGRFRVHAEKGALDHTDQFNLKSERQRLRFAQACDAKEPGCLDEVLRRLEKEALKVGFKYNADHDDGCRFVFTRLDKFTAEPIDWLWHKYVPAGAVTILDGDPGVGKSLVLCDLAARVSRGFLAPDRNPAFDEPGHDPEPIPGLVWWFAGGDRLEQTLLPRLLAAGADPSMVRVIEGTEDMKSGKCRQVRFPDDFHSLWKSQALAPRLVVVDPLSAFCGGALHQQTALKVMGELANFASATGAAVIVVRPLNRRFGSSASDRGAAGASLLAAAKSALLLAPHPDDPTKKVLAPIKSNLCALASSLALSVIDQASPELERASPERQRRESIQTTSALDGACADADGSPLGPRSSSLPAPLICWHGPSPLQADDLVRSKAPAARSPFEQKKVEEWLNEKLAAGPKPAQEIKEQAALDEIPPVLLRRAQISLNVLPAGRNGRSTWRLPDVSLNAESNQQPRSDPPGRQPPAPPSTARRRPKRPRRSGPHPNRRTPARRARAKAAPARDDGS